MTGTRTRQEKNGFVDLFGGGHAHDGQAGRE
jgi:hypothetical protein